MQRTFLYAKIHQATVTQADLHYEGSFSIDEDIMEAATILEHEQIQIYNMSNAARLTTYAIRAPRGSKTMGANGACAHLIKPGDRVIICAYATIPIEKYPSLQPTVLFLDEKNHYTRKKSSTSNNLTTC